MGSPGLDVGQSRKCVAFCDAGSEEVHIADEWDRMPPEPARSLSYQDTLQGYPVQRPRHRHRLRHTRAPFFHVPTSNRNNPSSARKASKLEAVASPGLPPPSPLFLDSPRTSSLRSAPNLLGSAMPIRRRNVMYINGQEIDLDEEEDEQLQTTPAEETIRPELVTCSFRPPRSRSISEAPLKQKQKPPIPIVAPIPTPQKAPSPSSSPISLSPIKIHSSSPVQSRPSVRSPPATNAFAPIKVVRATRDNTNPSNLVSLSSSWRRSPSPRTSPVLVPLA